MVCEYFMSSGRSAGDALLGPEGATSEGGNGSPALTHCKNGTHFALPSASLSTATLTFPHSSSVNAANSRVANLAISDLSVSSGSGADPKLSKEEISPRGWPRRVASMSNCFSHCRVHVSSSCVFGQSFSSFSSSTIDSFPLSAGAAPCVSSANSQPDSSLERPKSPRATACCQSASGMAGSLCGPTAARAYTPKVLCVVTFFAAMFLASRFKRQNARFWFVTFGDTRDLVVSASRARCAVTAGIGWFVAKAPVGVIAAGGCAGAAETPPLPPKNVLLGPNMDWNSVKSRLPSLFLSASCHSRFSCEGESESSKAVSNLLNTSISMVGAFFTSASNTSFTLFPLF
mmetsp:Transcript_3930/g.9576  ORF Transcript_3930/g.9576 Transcript_3930/m.9576 type:complete len:345 (-) Transcript_3930:850-1884(-)